MSDLKENSGQTYSSALMELEGIVEKLEKGEISIDELEEKVQRAAELLKYCDKKLRATEERVKTTIQEIKDISDKENTNVPATEQQSESTKDDDLPF